MSPTLNVYRPCSPTWGGCVVNVDLQSTVIDGWDFGHSSVAITLDIYSHVLPGLQKAAARRFEEGLQGAPDELFTENVAKMSPNLPHNTISR